MPDEATTPPATTTEVTPPAVTPAATTAPDTSDHFVPQKDVDRIVGERLGRERQKFETDYASKVEDLKKSTRAEVEAEFNGKLVNERTLSIAKDLGFHDPKDGLSVIDSKALPLKDGSPDEEKIKSALEKLAGEKKYLVKEPGSTTKTTTAGKPKVPAGNPSSGEQGQEDHPKAAAALRALAAQKHR